MIRLTYEQKLRQAAMNWLANNPGAKTKTGAIETVESVMVEIRKNNAKGRVEWPEACDSFDYSGTIWCDHCARERSEHSETASELKSEPNESENAMFETIATIADSKSDKKTAERYRYYRQIHTKLSDHRYLDLHARGFDELFDTYTEVMQLVKNNFLDDIVVMAPVIISVNSLMHFLVDAKEVSYQHVVTEQDMPAIAAENFLEWVSLNRFKVTHDVIVTALTELLEKQRKIR